MTYFCMLPTFQMLKKRWGRQHLHYEWNTKLSHKLTAIVFMITDIRLVVTEPFFTKIDNSRIFTDDVLKTMQKLVWFYNTSERWHRCHISHNYSGFASRWVQFLIVMHLWQHFVLNIDYQKDAPYYDENEIKGTLTFIITCSCFVQIMKVTVLLLWPSKIIRILHRMI